MKGEVVMSRYFRKLIVVAIFFCLAFIQPTQSITKISKAPVTDSEITAADYPAEVSAAQLTSPTTFPIQSERKADSTFLEIDEVIFENWLFIDADLPRKLTSESAGFLYVRQCQSSYLPLHL